MTSGDQPSPSSVRRGELIGTVFLSLAGPPGRNAQLVGGPLLLDWQSFGVLASQQKVKTDGRVRSTYHSPRIADVLYAEEHRCHRERVELVLDADNALRVTDVEVVTCENTHLAVLHVEASGPDPAGRLSALLQPPPGPTAPSPIGDHCRALFDVDVTERGRRRGSCLLFVPDPPLDESQPRSNTGWSRLDEALWAAAFLTPTSIVPPDPEDPRFSRGVVHLSATWRALALADGVGFAWRADAGDSFLPSAKTLVRTVYTDSVLLGVLQRAMLERLADDLAKVDNRADALNALETVERRATAFRNRLWWDDVAVADIGNVLLQATQAQLRTPQLFDRVMEDLQAFRAAVDTEQLRSANKRQARFELIAKRAGAAFAAVTLVLAVLGLNIEGWTSGGLAWWAVLGAAAGSGVAAVGIYELVRSRDDEAR